MKAGYLLDAVAKQGTSTAGPRPIDVTPNLSPSEPKTSSAIGSYEKRLVAQDLRG